MRLSIYIVLLAFNVLMCLPVKAQDVVNFHEESLVVTDTILELSFSPVIVGSVLVYCQGQPMAESLYHLDAVNGRLIFSKRLECKKVLVSYRSYYSDFSEKKSQFITNERDGKQGGSFSENKLLVFHPLDSKNNVLDDSKIKLQGSIGRGVSVGNKQNAVLNSNLDLQVEGDLGEGLMMRASITDRNIPVQPDGTTQQLQDFDQVFVEVFNSDFKLTAGDFSISQKDDAFLRYSRKTQGALLETDLGEKDKIRVRSSLGGAAARGKYHRMSFPGIEGSQGPYKLRGANNEAWIVVLSGTERVFINGELMERGQSRDYVVDYNTGELTFTANRLVNKDSRIVVEFEYSDRNYNRFLLSTEHEIETDKGQYFVRYFSESDAKNQPVDQNMDSEKRLFLATVGDDLQNAAFPSFDSLGFDAGQVRYQMKDTIVNGLLYDSVFVYSVNPDIAVYQLGFSLVGEGNGNYVKLINSVNGKVYEWVAPVNGVPQGNYEPVTILVAPRKQQVISMGGVNPIGKKLRLYYEFAFSNQDLNMYSNKDSEDDKGYACLAGVDFALFEKEKHQLLSNVEYQIVQHDFTQIENFRETEFVRNWNVDQVLSGFNEHLAAVNFNYSFQDYLKAKASSSMLYRQGNYKGFKQNAEVKLNKDGWSFLFFGDLLNSSRKMDDSGFLKHRLSLGKKFNYLSVFLEEYQEWNRWMSGDSLLGPSFKFQEMKAWIAQGSKSVSVWKLQYKYRLDELPYRNLLVDASEAHDFSASVNLVSEKELQLSAKLGFRKLDVLNKDLIDLKKSQNSLTSQLRFQQIAWGGFLQTNLFYEAGAGLELKKEFTYIEVPSGQGVYSWNDYDGDAVEDLDEFEIAAFSDEARYIRIYTPGNESVRTFNNLLSLSLRMKPEALLPEGSNGFLKRFYNQLSVSLSNKNTSDQWYYQYTPLVNFQNDSSMVYLNNMVRNVFSFNRFSRVFAMDLVFLKNRSNSLLVNGLDQQSRSLTEIRTRMNLSRAFSVEFNGGLGEKKYASEFFNSKNYQINNEKTELSFIYQPDINMRVRIFGAFIHKEDLLTSVFSRQLCPGVEYRNNAFVQGMLSAKMEYTYAEYSGESNSSLAYQMLDALQAGHNMIFTLSFQKRLANGLQINLNYQGRKPSGLESVHTGGVQVRAFF